LPVGVVGPQDLEPLMRDCSGRVSLLEIIGAGPFWPRQYHVNIIDEQCSVRRVLNQSEIQIADSRTGKGELLNLAYTMLPKTAQGFLTEFRLRRECGSCRNEDGWTDLRAGLSVCRSRSGEAVSHFMSW